LLIIQSRDIRHAECGEFRLIELPPFRDDGIIETMGQSGSPNTLGAGVFNDQRARFAVSLKIKVIIPDGLTDNYGRDEQEKIVAWLRKEQEWHPKSDYSGFVAIIADEIEAGQYLK
jgi:hypothetical protein